MFFKSLLPGYQPGEIIELFVRRSWFVFFSAIFIHLVLALVPPITYYVVPGFFDLLLSFPRALPFLVILGSVYYLLIWMLLFTKFLIHLLDVWIVTNMRVINIIQEGLFARSVAEQRLDKIQDVTYEIDGFFPTMFKYGNVYVQTAGQKERFVFEEVPNPDAVAQVISKLASKYKP